MAHRTPRAARRVSTIIAGLLVLSACNGATERGPIDARIGARAMALLQPVGPAIPIDPAIAGGSEVACQGQAEFATTPDGTNLTLMLGSCGFAVRPVSIRDGPSCADALAQAPAWDTGENIPEVTTSRSGVGSFYYTRPYDDARPWSIGEPAEASLVGRLLLIHDRSDMRPIACGQITELPSPPFDPNAPLPPLEYRSALAGQCIWDLVSRTSTQACPDPQTVVDCATTHCNLSQCAQSCAEHIACLQTVGDPCSTECTPTGDCSECVNRMPQCMFGFCVDALACAAPVTPDGPCSKIERCCEQQMEFAPACFDMLERVEKLSGDPTCEGWLHDVDWNTNKAYPCTYE